MQLHILFPSQFVFFKTPLHIQSTYYITSYTFPSQSFLKFLTIEILVQEIRNTIFVGSLRFGRCYIYTWHSVL